MNRPVLFIISMAIAVGLYLAIQKIYLTIMEAKAYKEELEKIQKGLNE